MNASLDVDAPSLENVEDKIKERLAHAEARAESVEVTPEGAEAELREAINEVSAGAKLEELRSELGLN
jgi:phage shock protein A